MADTRNEDGHGGICADRVCIVTGGARGIGRQHVTMLVEQGARVVVNDVADGDGRSSAADELVREITGNGGQAVASVGDVSDWGYAQELIAQAVETFGGLDVLVNNAGILRDRMLVNMDEREWDDIMRVHLKGTFAPARWAAAYWRDRVKEGAEVDARIINTTSVSGIYGNPGQSNYGAAKMGIAGFTVIAAMELARYGVTVNAIAPTALTRLTESIPMGQDTEEGRRAIDPRWVASVCAWLASPRSRGVTGRVFEASGHTFAVADGWHRGPSCAPSLDPWVVDELAHELLAAARPNANIEGR